MSNEVEAKLSVESFQPLRDALHTAGATYLGTVLQTDTYYDTPGGQLAGSDRGMRIRRVELLDPGRGEWDLRPQLTYKGPRKTGADYKTRREIQTHFDAPYAMAEVLEVCGLAVSMIIQKRRSSYRLDSCMVELDELPIIGRFVEIEGPDEQTISSTCRALGLDGQVIHDSYLRLAEAACKKQNRDSHKVTFAVEAEVENGR